MEINSLDDVEDGEHNSVGFVEVSKIFLTEDAFLFATAPFDSPYKS